MPLEGLQLGKYHLTRIIGSGGMGDVYVGEDVGIGRQVAVKVMRAEPSSYPDEDVLKHGERLFQREMRAVAMLDHPHILPLFDYGEELLHKTTLLYMVMPFRQEGSFADWLRQRTGLLPLQEVAYFLSQAAEALQHAHDHQIVHQDVKPSNFLIRHKRTATSLPDLLLADFGIARISSLTSSVSHSSRGTPTYMAPEQWSGDPVLATDQYALAIMAYELVAGRPPFTGRPEQMMFMHISTPPAAPSTLRAGLSAGIDAVILRALSKKPEERFSTITDFATAFQQAVERRGDLHATLAISSYEAMTGTARELTLPGGRKALVTIPQGIQEGQVLSLAGLGEPYYNEGPRGQLILTVTIAPLEKTIFVQESSYEKTIAASHAPNPQLMDKAPLIERAPPLETPSKDAVAQPAQKTKDDLQDEGDKLYSMRRYQQALKAYEEGLRLAPNDPVLRQKYEKLCKYLLIAPAKQSAYTKSPSVNSSASAPGASYDNKLDQKTKEQWLEEGDKLYSTRHYQQALSAYEKGLQLAPDDPILRQKYNNTRDYLKFIQRYDTTQEQLKSPTRQTGVPTHKNNRKTARIVVGLIVIVLLFLVINMITLWNTTIVGLTLFTGIIMWIAIIIG